eukprot:scaffold50491_cov19-Tisochrysis_lutea.AAC.2
MDMAKTKVSALCHSTSTAVQRVHQCVVVLCSRGQHAHVVDAHNHARLFEGAVGLVTRVGDEVEGIRFWAPPKSACPGCQQCHQHCLAAGALHSARYQHCLAAGALHST